MADQDTGVAAKSIFSRLDILVSDGIDQLSVNPVWGDLGVDRVTDHPGKYIHSIIAVQTHLGMIGSFLLFGALFGMLIRLYGRNGNTLLKLVTIPILLYAVGGAFFTWMPLWVVIGGMYSLKRTPMRRAASAMPASRP
ncbi:hypothetical protein [Mesorhizobium sp. SP-1A]|uniref:hypothetical protein n=1 Tax=Mesorhizobium sp. SP-1A TaxID=3077840 RepID=UPI0028F723CF|nr:hypothetical protein [Mesorhizobium sp. SP-1A]